MQRKKRERSSTSRSAMIFMGARYWTMTINSGNASANSQRRRSGAVSVAGLPRIITRLAQEARKINAETTSFAVLLTISETGYRQKSHVMRDRMTMKRCSV